MSDYVDVYGFHRHTEKGVKSKASKSKSSGDFQVKKREQYENEVVKYETNWRAIPMAYGDRFIPRRYFGQKTARSHHLSDENDNDILTMKKQPFYWRIHNYKIMLGNELCLADSARLLNFHDATVMQASEPHSSSHTRPIRVEHKVPSKSAEALDWPCKPRAKPFAYNDSTHDLPDFDQYESGHNIIDWSCMGQIAGGFEESLVLWGPPTEADKETSTVLYKMSHVKALKYSPDGLSLALSVNGITTTSLQIWDISDKMQIEQKVLYKFRKESPTEVIRSIEWSKFDTHIICGMSTGTVFVVSYEAGFKNFANLHRFDGHAKSTITSIKYSINGTHIGITDKTGQLSVLRNNATFEVTLKNHRAHFIAWHPWTEKYLFIGYKSPASIHLLDLKTKTTIAHYRRTDLQYTLCALSVNALSGEVVASFSHQVDHVTYSDILVMASMNRIVDNLSAHSDAVHFILWDPTGTKVATAGQDESLNIWQFFGKSQRKANELIKLHDTVKVPKHSKLNLENAFMMFR